MATSEVIDMPSLAERIKRFSNWYRAKRVVALCRKYIMILKGRVEKMTIERSINVEDIEEAGLMIIKSVQAESFPEELRVLLKANCEEEANIKMKSSLSKLDPFIDSKGVLRVRGRLEQADLSNAVKHPIILPSNNHVTTLIIRYFHEKAKHQGKGITFNEVRSNGFWIIGGTSSVNAVISSCVTCRKLRGAACQQKMSSLPEDRLECCPPFTYCGVDYFGPFVIKEGRKELKRYGVLFTCMSSRAIHLETAASLSTDSFMNALKGTSNDKTSFIILKDLDFNNKNMKK